MQASDARLKMAGVHKRFGATVALSGVDLHVASGEVLALVGENGAGKSTFMKILSGALQPDAGEMWLDGNRYSPRDPLDARRAGVGMIYQELSLAPHLSVMENIVLGMEPTRGKLIGGPLMDWREIRRRASEALATLGRSDISVDASVSRLPLASRQMVEIARALAIGCKVLVLDEPTSSLGKQDIEHLFAMIGRLKSLGHAVIYISHFLEEVKEISDRFTVLRDGKTVGGGETGSASTGGIISMMVGRDVQELYPRSVRVRGEAILEIEKLAGKAKPQAASLTLCKGEVLGIAGLIGAGRTELLRAIFGLNAVKSGEIRVGIYRGPKSVANRWKEKVGMVSEDRKGEGLALSRSIAENITLSRLPWFVSPRRLQSAADECIERLDIRCRSASQPAGSLSGGNQQKIALARLLHHDVDVWLLDEPTRGIDVASKAQIYRIIDQLACQGKAVLMVSSYLPELLGVCDRIAVMSRGVLGEAKPIGQVNEQQIMMEATGIGGSR